jgi:DNA-binding transcriptional MerR regulator
VARDAAGNRTYSEEDIQLLEMIRCLKNTGMPVNEIGAFIALCKQGDGTLEQRRQMLLTHQAHVEAKIEQMRQELEHIQAKLNYYDRACGQAVRPADSCGGR